MRLFSDELKEQEDALGKLLKEIISGVEDDSFPDRAAMLTLRAQFLYRRAVSMLQRMHELLGLDEDMDPMPNGEDRDERRIRDESSIKDLPLTILSQQIIMAEQQRTTLQQLYESLQEMRKAKSATPKVEHLVLLRQLKDSLEEFEKKDLESDKT